jgi:hypothetical protein
MSEEWVDIVPAQRRPAGEAAYKAWLALHGLTHSDVSKDLLLDMAEWWAEATLCDIGFGQADSWSWD